MARIQILLDCIVFAIITHPVDSSGKLSITLIDYKNPGSLLYNGECCDTLNFCTWNQCDNLFKFCLTAVNSDLECSLGSGTTKTLGDDDFRFSGSGADLGGGLRNPLVYGFQGWKGATLVVEVWDEDGSNIAGKLPDFVDKYTLAINSHPDRDQTASTFATHRLCGKRSCMNVHVLLYCDQNYLIPQCTEYCVSRDSDLEGHYVCDYVQGRKVCREGWYDAVSNCTKKKKECTPRNDTGGHFGCDPESGEKLCLEGWTGSNCTQVLLPSSMIPIKATPASTTSVHQLPTSTHAYAATSDAMLLQTPSSSTSHLSPSAPTTATSLSSSFSLTNIDSTIYRTIKTHEKELFTSVIRTSVALPWIHSTHSPQSSIVKATEYLPTSVIDLKSSPFLPSTSTFDQAKTSLVDVTTSSCVERTSVSSSSLYTESVSTVLVSKLATPTPRLVTPTTKWTDSVVIELTPASNWTNATEESLKKVITDHLIKYCRLSPQDCGTNSSTLINTTDIQVISRISSEGVTISMTGKIPVVGGGVVSIPSVVIKTVVENNKDLIQKELGITIKSDSSSTISESVTQHVTTRLPISTVASAHVTSIPPISEEPTHHVPALNSPVPVFLIVLAGMVVLLVVAGIACYLIKRKKKFQRIHISPRSPKHKRLRDSRIPGTSVTVTQLGPDIDDGNFAVNPLFSSYTIASDNTGKDNDSNNNEDTRKTSEIIVKKNTKNFSKRGTSNVTGKNKIKRIKVTSRDSTQPRLGNKPSIPDPTIAMVPLETKTRKPSRDPTQPRLGNKPPVPDPAIPMVPLATKTRKPSRDPTQRHHGFKDAKEPARTKPQAKPANAKGLGSSEYRNGNRKVPPKATQNRKLGNKDSYTVLISDVDVSC
ncbi:mucin-5AC [Nematostella vectensis]|uniref:mucin-5AC n=1 Tax=Nematostella vectensis TaxID=45351 RepID=UPI002076E048|nr:mucin-5AC [Nematostella vectensis]